MKNQKTNIQDALNEIKKGKSILSISKIYNIPRTNLARYYKQGFVPVSRGKKPLLSVEDEKKLADWLIDCAEMGDPRSKEELVSAAGEINQITERSKKKPLSSGWLNRFLKRNPEVKFRTPQAVTKASSKVSEKDIRRFFNQFTSWIEKNNFTHLLSDASRWLNSDESGFEMNPKPKKVLAKKGLQNVFYVESSKPKERISVMYTISADGSYYKPQIIFKKGLKKMNQILMALGEVNANYALSTSDVGYQTQDTFEAYVKEVLLKEIDEKGIQRDSDHPIFYFVDGHKSHYGFKFRQWCRENFIVLVTFFPNGTRIIQPCDVGLFGAAKTIWKNEVQQWKIEHDDANLDEIEFVKILKKTNDKFLKSSSIINSFRKTGIHPLNVENVDFSRCIGTNITTENTINHESQENDVASQSVNQKQQIIVQVEEAINGLCSNETFNTQDASALDSAIQQSSEKPTQSCISFEAESFFNEIENHLDRLNSHVHEKFPALNYTMMNVKQQMTLIKSVIISSLSSTVTNTSTENTSEERIHQVLKPPRKFCRSQNQKTYKMSNYGVMTSDDAMKEMKAFQEAQQKAQIEKENKANERRKQKEINEKIRNMKKEKAEERKRSKTATVEDVIVQRSQLNRCSDDKENINPLKRTRGRPPKKKKI